MFYSFFVNIHYFSVLYLFFIVHLVLLLPGLNHTQVINRGVLVRALEDRLKGVPLVTVSNHQSCCDEPLIWGGSLDLKHLMNQSLMRWALAAHDICFSNIRHANFFSYGKSIPIVRDGGGVYQKGMNFVLDRLNEGSWMHIYPEGKVNVDRIPELLRFKWGVGRLISDCRVTPIVIPIYHLGLDRVLPNKEPYIPQINQRVTICIGEPILLEGLLEELRATKASAEECRKRVTDVIQEHMHKLKITAQIYHAKHTLKGDNPTSTEDKKPK